MFAQKKSNKDPNNQDGWYGHAFWCLTYDGPDKSTLLKSPNGTSIQTRAKERWSGHDQKLPGKFLDQKSLLLEAYTALKNGELFWFGAEGLEHGSKRDKVNSYLNRPGYMTNTRGNPDVRVTHMDYIIDPKMVKKASEFAASYDFSGFGLDITATGGGCATYVGRTMKHLEIDEHLEFNVKNHIESNGATSKFPIVSLESTLEEYEDALGIPKDNDLPDSAFDAAASYFSAHPDTSAWSKGRAFNFYDTGLLSDWIDSQVIDQKIQAIIYRSNPNPQ